MRDELKIATIGLFAIIFLETYALYQGVDGTMFGTAMAGVGGIVGYVIKSRLTPKRKKKIKK